MENDIGVINYAEVGFNGPFNGKEQLSIPDGCAPLFGDRALARALFSSLVDEVGYQGEVAEVRRDVLRGLLNRSDGLIKRLFVPDDDALERLAAVGASSANAVRAVEVVYHAAALARATGTPLRVPPILLQGPPGSGKTRVARAIAAALDLPTELMSGSTMAEPGAVCGYNLAWRNPGMGSVAKALIAAPTLAVAVVVDEIDKLGSYVRDQDTSDALLPLLEPTTAANWTDDFLGAPMAADGLLWLMTCNDIELLSAPLRDRCIVIDVPALDGAGFVTALDDIMDELATESRLPAAGLSAEASVLLLGVSLRRARTALRLALAVAVTAGRRRVEPGDVHAALRLVGPGRSSEERRIGFVR